MTHGELTNQIAKAAAGAAVAGLVGLLLYGAWAALTALL